MNKIEELRSELKRQDDAMKENMKDIIGNPELTEDEIKRIEELKKEKHVVMVQTDENGSSVEIPISKYIESVEKNISKIEGTNIRLLTSKITKTKEDLINESMKELEQRKVDETVEKDEMDQAIDDALKIVQDYFKTDKLTYDHIGKLAKMKAVEITNLFPKSFKDIFCENIHNTMKVKEDILTAFGYCVMVGPEMDSLSEEIEHKNQMIDLMVRLNDINIDHAKMISSEESIKDMVSQILKEGHPLSDKYRKYVKSPDAINNMYSQKKYTLTSLNVAYEGLRNSLTSEEEKNEITKEIQNNKIMIDIYSRLLNLDRFKLSIASIVDAHKDGISKKQLDTSAYVALDSFRKVNLHLNIPNYPGEGSNMKEVYNKYLIYFDKLIPAYNHVVSTAIEKGDTDLELIDTPGDIFAQCVLITLKRIVKILGKNGDNASMSEIVATFDMICCLGTELFVLNNLNKIIKPLYSIVK